jgi:hypothetical protein
VAVRPFLAEVFLDKSGTFQRLPCPAESTERSGPRSRNQAIEQRIAALVEPIRTMVMTRII